MLAVLKRVFDVLISAVALLLLMPVLVVVAVLVAVQHGRPVLFVDVRPGRDGEPFKLWKFRTMTNAEDAAGQLLPDERRLTRLGRWLRASSLDELPELVNVLRGDMSLVGPRPLLMEYLPLYSATQARRHEVRPGITGWAQVKGRNALTWEEKFDLDVWYVDNRSFGLDLRILWRTFATVLRQEGISHPGQSTMPRFKGTST